MPKQEQEVKDLMHNRVFSDVPNYHYTPTELAFGRDHTAGQAEMTGCRCTEITAVGQRRGDWMGMRGKTGWGWSEVG